jgi:hypothetical protein
VGASGKELRRETMKRLPEFVFIIVIAAAAGAISATVALHRSQVVAGNVNQQTDAAFRDGLFLARLDAEHGRKPHLASGRWSTDADRRSFVTAYLQAYRERQGGAASEQFGSSPLAAQRGYRDGITDGLQQRGRLGSFRANATEKYQKADHGYSDSNGDLNEYKQSYREAYCNGYQQAYYRETENIEAAIFSGANAPE